MNESGTTIDSRGAGQSVRVLYLKQRFDPEPAPLRGSVFTAALRDRGIETTVLTGFPYYPHPQVHEGWSQQLHATDVVDGTPVHRSGSIVGHTAGPLRRLLTYTTMPAMSVGNALRNRLDADLVLTTMGPGVYAHFALLLARRLGVPAVLEIQDLWPESLLASGMWPRQVSVKPVDAAMSYAYSNAAGVICLSDGCRDTVIARGADPATTRAMLNWAPPLEETPDDADQARAILGDWVGQDFVAYAGALGPLQGVSRMCDAAERANTRLMLIGAGRESEAITSRAANSSLIRAVGQLSPGVTRAILRHAAATTVYLASSELDESAIPSKVASNLLAGRPMIVAAAGETARLAERIGAGPRCAPGDTDELARIFGEVGRASTQQRARWGKAGLDFAERWFEPQRGLDRYAEFLREISAKRPIRQAIGSEYAPG